MEWYKFDITAFERDTLHLKRPEKLVYRELLDLYYKHERPIRNQARYVHNMLQIVSRRDKIALKNVLVEFFILDPKDDCFHQKRADQEIAEYTKRRATNRDAAKVRWKDANRNATADASAHATAMPVQTNSTYKGFKESPTRQERAADPRECAAPDCNKPGRFGVVNSNRWYCEEHKFS